MSPRPARLLVVSVALAAAIAGAGGGAATVALLPDDEPEPVVQQVTVASPQPAAVVDEPLSTTEVYERSAASVVEVTVSSGGAQGLQGGQAQRAQGSGFVYDAQGHVITNQHVVEGAQTVSVTFADGTTRSAEVVGTDASTDVAVLRVDDPPADAEPLPLGDSDALAVGEEVVAIGSPFGLEGTVTSGIVSALHRQMTSPNGFTINDSIQTDAAINHGNSGGPLLNAAGEVIGVNAQIESESGGNDGVGFAVPSNTVEAIVGQILETGTAEHAYLGVGIATIPESAASGLGRPAGAAVTEVRAGTPAADAGLRGATGSQDVAGESYPTGGDVITALDGQPIASAEELQRAIDARRPGDTVTLTVDRDGETRTVEVTLGTRPS